MKWTQFSVKTNTNAVDMVSYTLGELGVEGIEIEDHVPLSENEKKQMFVDILPDIIPDDGTAMIRFYRDPEDDYNVLLESINNGHPRDFNCRAGPLSDYFNTKSIGKGIKRVISVFKRKR